MGVPHMQNYWNNLQYKNKSRNASKYEVKLYKKIGKALYHLSIDPRYPGLNTHEIKQLSTRCGLKVWESYLENKVPSAGRIFWVYGPNDKTITIIGIENHPNNKKDSYRKIELSSVKQD